MTVTATMATRPSEKELAGFDPDANPGMPDQDEGTTDQATADSIGVATIPLTPTIARQVGVDASTRGLVITAVDPSSDAGRKLRRGDVIVSANGAQVTTPKDLADAVAAAKRAGRSQVLLFIQRGSGNGGFIPVGIKD
jgi:serine protease Do